MPNVTDEEVVNLVVQADTEVCVEHVLGTLKAGERSLEPVAELGTHHMLYLGKHWHKHANGTRNNPKQMHSQLQCRLAH